MCISVVSTTKQSIYLAENFTDIFLKPLNLFRSITFKFSFLLFFLRNLKSTHIMVYIEDLMHSQSFHCSFDTSVELIV